jgi:hypothetical protein
MLCELEIGQHYYMDLFDIWAQSSRKNAIVSLKARTASIE